MRTPPAAASHASVLLRYLELCVAVGVEGDGDEIRPAAYCTVLGVDLPRATTGIHEVSFSSPQNAHA